MKTNKNYEATINSNKDAYNAIKRHDPKRFEITDELDVWFEFQTAPTIKIKDAAQEELLYRHNAMLSKIAHHMTQYYPKAAEFNDFINMARNGAIVAYGRYNPYKEGKERINKDGVVEKGEVASLSTFVFNTVERHILSCIDDESFIHCPAQKRGFRAYFRGRYNNNPEKKIAFEEKNGLGSYDEEGNFITSPEAIQKAKEKYELLNAEIISYDMHWSNEDGEEMRDDFGGVFIDENAETSDRILTRLSLEGTIKTLNDLQKQVFNCVLVEQNSIKDAAINLKVSQKEIQDCVKQIRAAFRKRHPDLANGRSKHHRKKAA